MSAPKCAVRKRQGLYVVVDGAGNAVSAEHRSFAQADVIRDAKQRHADRLTRGKNRPCMCCRTEFLSEGAHNRLCGNCRTRTATSDLFPGAIDVSGRRSKR